jgi:hypothetical protein
MLGGCWLTEHDDEDDGIVPGEWRPATCEEFTQALADHGYNEPDWNERVCVYGTLTDTLGKFGEPTIFTEWGTKDGHQPIAAFACDPRMPRTPCSFRHMVYVPTVPTEETPNAE